MSRPASCSLQHLYITTRIRCGEAIVDLLAGPGADGGVRCHPRRRKAGPFKKQTLHLIPSFALVLFCWKNRLPLLSISDAVAVVTPIGLFFGRIANFNHHPQHASVERHPAVPKLQDLRGFDR